MENQIYVNGKLYPEIDFICNVWIIIIVVRLTLRRSEKDSDILKYEVRATLTFFKYEKNMMESRMKFKRAVINLINGQNIRQWKPTRAEETLILVDGPFVEICCQFFTNSNGNRRADQDYRFNYK